MAWHSRQEFNKVRPERVLTDGVSKRSMKRDCDASTGPEWTVNSWGRKIISKIAEVRTLVE